MGKFVPRLRARTAEEPRRQRGMRLLSGAVATALLAGLIAVGVPLAATADPVAPPNGGAAGNTAGVGLGSAPGNDRVVIRVDNAGGDRSAGGNISPLAGVQYGAYSQNGVGDSPSSGSRVAWCTTDANGQCWMNVPTRPQGYLVAPIDAPDGWSLATFLRPGNGTSFPNTRYQFHTGAIAGNANQAARTITVPNSTQSTNSSDWLNVRDNPVVLPQCGIDVALLVDLSYSIAASGGQDEIQDAATAFVDALTGTPSRVAIHTFGTTSPAANSGGDIPGFPGQQRNANLGYQSVADAASSSAKLIRAKAQNLTVPSILDAQYTNWDRGLWSIRDLPQAPKLVVVITDGNPTRYGQPAQGSGSSTRFIELEHAMASANTLKAAGSRVVVVGVGDGVSGQPYNLQAVSGYQAGDYYAVDDFGQLADFAESLASANCAGVVNVVKQVRSVDGSTTTPGIGWQFGAKSTQAAVALDGSGNPFATSAGGTTNATGGIGFRSNFTGTNTAGRRLTITETQKSGHQLLQVGGFNARCWLGNDQTATVAVTNVANGFEVDPVSGQTVNCQVINQALDQTARLRVDKVWNVDADGNGSIDATSTNTASPPVVSGKAQLGVTGVSGLPATPIFGEEIGNLPVGGTVTVTETVSELPPNCSYTATFSPVLAGGQFSLTQTSTQGVNLVTITNKVTCVSKLTLEKDVSDDSAAPTKWALDAIAPGGALPGPAGRTGDAAATAPVTPNAVYPLSEDPDADVEGNYVQLFDPTSNWPTQWVPNRAAGSTGSWVCVQATQIVGGVVTQWGTTRLDGRNGGVQVPEGQWYKCTAVNDPKPTLQLIKKVDRNGVISSDGAAAWTLAASWTPPALWTPVDNDGNALPAGQLPATQAMVSGAGGFASMRVLPGTYTLTESASPSGYTNGTVWSCVINGSAPVTLPANTLSLASGDTASCEIVNRRDTVRLTLVKVVNNDDGGPATADQWTLTAGSVVSGKGTLQPDASASIGADVQPLTPYVLSESGGPAGYEPEGGWVCARDEGGASVPLDGTGAVTLPVGVDVTCEIINTDLPGEIVAVKRDEVAPFALLAGATFQLWDDVNGNGALEPATDTTVGAPVVSGANGEAAWTDVAWGSYLVEEVAAPPGYDLATVNVKPAVVGPAGTDGTPIGVEFSNPRLTGSVSWTKVEAGTDTLLGGTTWTLTHADGGTITVVDNGAGDADPDAGELLVQGLVWGDWTLEETATPDGFTPTDEVFEFTISPTSLAAVIGEPIENERQTGTLAITKAVDAPAGAVLATAEFEGSYACTFDDGVTVREYDGTWTITGVGAAALTPGAGQSTDFPLGTDCTVDETAPDGGLADASWRWVDATYSPADGSVTITAEGAAATVTVTNHVARVRGTISITKTYDAPAGAILDGATFSGSYSCAYDGPTGDEDYSGTWTVTGEGAATLTPDSGQTLQFPLGTVCDADEDADSLDADFLFDESFSWGEPAVTPDGGATVAAEGQAAGLTVTNTVQRVYGHFSVTKIVTGISDAGLDFTGGYTCTYEPDGTIVGGTWGPISAAETWTHTAAPGILVGSECVVSDETTPPPPVAGDPSYQWDGAPDLGDPVTIVPAGQGTVPVITVTNTSERLFGELVIEKEFADGTPAGLLDDVEFTGTYECAVGAETFGGDWSVTGAGTATLVGDTDIPLGAECSVTEDDPSAGDLPISWRWLPADVSDDVAISDQPSTVTVTNAVERVYGEFAVTKTVSGTADAGLQFSGTFTCTFAPDVSTVSGTWGPIAAGGTWTSTAYPTIPVGSSCAVTDETMPAGPVAGDSSFVWVVPADFGTPVSAVEPGQNAEIPAVTVTNTSQRVTGAFAVTKTVLGDGEGVDPANSEFSFEWSCVAANGDEFPADAPGEFTLADGEAWNAPSVPLGSECTVTELTPPAPIDPSYAWTSQLTVSGATGTPGAASVVFTLPATPAAVLVTAANTLTRTVGTVTFEKSSDPVSGSDVAPGDTVKYTVIVRGGDLGFVDDVVVTDDLSDVVPLATVVPGSISADRGTAVLDDADAPTKLVWTVGTVHADDVLTLTYEVEITDAALGESIRNVVTATGEVTPECIGTCETEHDVPFDDVGIVKSSSIAAGATVDPGQAFTYTLRVTNHGSSAATDVEVTDTVPARLQVTGVTVPAGWTNASTGNSVVATIPSLAVGASADIVVNVTVLPGENPPPAEIGADDPVPPLPDPVAELENKACVTAAADEDDGNDCSEITIPLDDIIAQVLVRCVNDAPFLEYAVATSPSLAGMPITMTWTPDAGGPGTKPQNEQRTLSSGDSGQLKWPGAGFSLSGISIDWPGWRPLQESDYDADHNLIPAPALVYNGMVLDATEPDYAWRGSTTVTFSVNPETSISATYPEASDACEVARESELQVVKRASVERTQPGSEFTYTIDVTNVHEFGAADGVVLTDFLPPALKVNAITTSTTAFPRWENCALTGQDADGYGGEVRCELFGPLMMGESAPPVLLDVTVDPASTAASVFNGAIVEWYTFGRPDDPGSASSGTTVLLGALAITGMPPVDAAIWMGLAALFAGVILLHVRRAQGRRRIVAAQRVGAAHRG